MKYFSLLPSTIITKGKNKACFIDTEKSRFFTTPLYLSSIFNGKKTFNKEKLINSLPEKLASKIQEFLCFLSSEGFGVTSTHKIKFKYYDHLNIDIPFLLKDIIVDADSEASCITKLNAINITPKHMQIRLFFNPTKNNLKKIIEFCVEKGFINIEIILNHIPKFNNYEALLHKNNIIARIVVMNHSENTVKLKSRLITVKEKLKSIKQDGLVSKKLFMPNIFTVKLNQNYNGYLFKKLSIDLNGDIRNCPSMPESYGNIKDTTLEEAIGKLGFKKYWNITKDDIEVCRDCEFRYICIDCRAYTERTTFNEEGLDLSKPLKCGYNPYTNEWAEWSTNPLKQKAIKYYGMEELVKKNEA